MIRTFVNATQLASEKNNTHATTTFDGAAM